MAHIQRWLKRITPDRTMLQKHWYLRPFAAIAMQPRCWSFNRRGVTRAFSLGLFIAFIPPTPLPIHLLIATLCGILFELNLPVLFATVFLSNPMTWLFQVAGSIWVGARLLGIDLTPLMRHLGHKTAWAHLHQLWTPLLLGAVVLGLVSAILGYILAQCLWRLHAGYQWRHRKSRQLPPGSFGQGTPR